MADVLQEAFGGITPKLPSISLPSISTYDALLYGMIAIFVLMIVLFVMRFLVYKVKILALEDRGRGSLLGRIYAARHVTVNGTPRYQLLGKKDSYGNPYQIMASTSDNIIPLKTALGTYRDLVVYHVDKNGDFRPFKPIVSAEQVNIKDFQIVDERTGGALFKYREFVEWMFPLLKIDNLKMRDWHILQTKETFSTYIESGATMKKIIKLMPILFIIFAVCMGAYMLLK